MTDFTKIPLGTPLQLTYNIDLTRTALLIKKEDNKNYFIGSDGVVFTFSDKFIDDKVTIELDNLDVNEVARISELIKQ